jgi:hypothetical protein
MAIRPFFKWFVLWGPGPDTCGGDGWMKWGTILFDGKGVTKTVQLSVTPGFVPRTLCMPFLKKRTQTHVQSNESIRLEQNGEKKRRCFRLQLGSFR